MAKITPEANVLDIPQEPVAPTNPYEQADVDTFNRIYERYGPNLHDFFRDALSEVKRNAIEKCVKRNAEA